MQPDQNSFGGRTLSWREFGSLALIQSEYFPHERLAEHCHERAYISVVLRGSYHEQCGLYSWECKSGEAVFHVAGEHHSDLFHEQGARMLNFEISPSLLNRVRALGVSTEQRVAVASPYAVQIGLKLMQEAGSADPVAPIAAEGLVMELLAEIFRRKERRDPDWLERVRDMLHETYRESKSLCDLAREFDVHPAHLARAFRKRYRCSIGDYIRILRVEAARQDLQNSNDPVAEIAARTGFADQSHLCRMLRKYTGMSPRDLRDARRGQR